jgi:hypothetical protein
MSMCNLSFAVPGSLSFPFPFPCAIFFFAAPGSHYQPLSCCARHCLSNFNLL